MNRMILAAVLLAGTALTALPARADVVLDTTGQGGTGDNVIFSSIASSSLILGTLNGQHQEVVRFRDLSGNGNFSGSANGNDIKIINTSDLDITVFDHTDVTQVTTSRDIFSLKGTGEAFIRVTALESDGTFKTFNFTNSGAGYTLGNNQSGFDLKAINGESIFDIDLFVLDCTTTNSVTHCVPGGSITDFEHYRIDVATLAVPAPAVGAGIPGLIAACGGLFGCNWYRRRRNGGHLVS